MEIKTDKKVMFNVTIDNPQPYNKIGDGPEGPEVYVMTRRLRNRFPAGHCLVKIVPLCVRYKKGNDAIPKAFTKVLPLKITKITSKGKKTIIKFNKKWALLISYGMTGHWEKAKSKYSQLEFTFSNPAGLETKYYWVSSRSLPTCVVQFLKHNVLTTYLEKLGFDIIRDDPDPDTVLDVSTGSKKNVCAFMMEQDKYCGIGNYIKSVVLYRCGISPHHKMDELDDGNRWLIWDVAKEVAQEAITARGMGMRDYKDENGKRVGVAFDITPYNMKRDKMGNKVVSEMIAGRMTWWVPKVQR